MRLLRYGLLFVLAGSAAASPQPPETLAAVYRAGKAVGVAAQGDCLKAQPRGRFRRAVSAFRQEIRLAQALALGPEEKKTLAEYGLAARQLEASATNFEVWATMDDRVSVSDDLAAAVPATRGGVDAKGEILAALDGDRQRAMAEASLALARAKSALKEGNEHLAKAERAYLDARPRAPAPD